MLDVTVLAHAERVEFAGLLRSLTPEQWSAPSLCDEWTVRDVVAHVLSYEELTAMSLLRRFARGKWRLGGANAIGTAEFASQTPEQLQELLARSFVPRGLTTAFGSRIALLDGMIHQQDIRRPLGIPRHIPPERLVPALNFACVAPPIGAYRRIIGVRLVATDMAWTWGYGREVRGAGEALLMAVAGRRNIADELDGPGVALLRSRSAVAP